MKVVADNSGSGAATTSTRIEDSGRNPQIIPGQKSAWRRSSSDLLQARLDNFLLADNTPRTQKLER
jgi:hypothetical protein